MSNNLNTGHMISKPISSLSGVPIFEVTTWTVPFLHRDHHANPEPCHFILKSSKTVLKPFTDFRYKKRPPKPNHVPCCWKKRDLWLDQLLSWSCWFKKQFFDKTHPELSRAKLLSRVQPLRWLGKPWLAMQGAPGKMGKMESNGVESSLVLQIRIPC